MHAADETGPDSQAKQSLSASGGFFDKMKFLEKKLYCATQQRGTAPDGDTGANSFPLLPAEKSVRRPEGAFYSPKQGGTASTMFQVPELELLGAAATNLIFQRRIPRVAFQKKITTVKTFGKVEKVKRNSSDKSNTERKRSRKWVSLHFCLKEHGYLRKGGTAS